MKNKAEGKDRDEEFQTGTGKRKKEQAFYNEVK